MKKWALFFALIFATSATAQTSAPVRGAAQDWSGWYAGMHLGYGFGHNHITLTPESAGALARPFVNTDLGVNPHGFLGGVHLGRNWQQGRFIYGFESDLAYAGIRYQVLGALELPGPFFFDTTQAQKLNTFGTLRARMGTALSGRVVAYLTGGLAYGEAELSTFSRRTGFPCVGANFCVTGQSRKWLAGWTIGTGMDYALAGNWSAKFEYLYYDLGKIDSSVADVNPASFAGVPGPDFFRGSARINGSIVKLGLSYRFNP